MENINLEHFLEFRNEGVLRIPITECFKFDGATFSTEQEKGRFGRDIAFGNEETSLIFYKGLYDATTNSLELPDGSVVFNLTMGFEHLIRAYKLYGYEADVLHIVKKEGLEFIIGNLEFGDSVKTDLDNFLECKIVQQTAKAQIKRQEETKINIFSDKDIDGNDIAPVDTIDVLLKAMPLSQVSEWTSNTNSADGFARVTGNPSAQDTDRAGSNNSNVLGVSGVENSLTWISNRYALVPATGGYYVPNDGNNFALVEAAEELTDITLDFTDITASAFQTAINVGTSTEVDTGTGKVRFLVVVGTLADYNNPREVYTLWEKDFSYLAGISEDADLTPLDPSYTLNIPIVLAGERVWAYLESDASATFTGSNSFQAQYVVTALMESMKTKVSGISTAIDSVTKAVRYVDGLKQIPLAINGMPVVAPRYESGGEFYNQVIYNGKMIRQQENPTFELTHKRDFSDLQECAGDYQVTKDKIFIGKYPDFYPNRLLGTFLQVPTVAFESIQNERYALNRLEWKYKHYEQNRDEKNTSKAIHTEAQFSFPNKQVENHLKIELDLVRDPFRKESARKAATGTMQSTSLSDDDNIFIDEIIPIAPNTQKSFTRNLLQRINADTGYLEILNSADTDAGTFNWMLLGASLGSDAAITLGDNSGAYVIESYTPSVITLSGGSPSFEGVQIITFEYTLSSVFYTNRTNEGISTTGIDNPAGFSNLNFSPTGNLKAHWGSYLSTCGIYHLDKDFKNTSYKNKPSLEDGEDWITIDGDYGQVSLVAPINCGSTTLPLITPEIIRVEIVCSFEQMVTLHENMNTVYDDGTIGGYIIAVNPEGREVKGFSRKDSYVWVDGVLKADLEVKYEPIQVIIDGDNITSDYGSFDFESLELEAIDGEDVIRIKSGTDYYTKWHRVTEIEVNGVTFSNLSDLQTAIAAL